MRVCDSKINQMNLIYMEITFLFSDVLLNVKC